jgi:transcriptional regulator with XRE-family HTH domain
MKERSLDEFINSLPSDAQADIQTRAVNAIEEEMTLRQLRKARRLSQDTVAKSLHISQSDVSKLERRTDVYISTLRNFIEATGGELEIIARYPDRSPVRIHQFQDVGDDEQLLQM